MTERRIQQLAAEGVMVRVGRGQYDLLESVRNYITFLDERTRGPGGSNVENLEDWGGARTRRMVAQAEMSELEAAEKAGSLLPVEMVTAAWNRMVESARARFLNLPSVLAPVVTSEQDYGRNRAIITEAVHDALNEVAGITVVRDSSGAFLIQSTGTAGTEKRQPVGRRKKNTKRGGKRRTRKVE
jgi:hypothetical protein